MLRTDGEPDDPIGWCRHDLICDCTRGLAVALMLANRLKTFDTTGMRNAEADLAATVLLCNLDEIDAILDVETLIWCYITRVVDMVRRL